jgi:UDP-glucose 4-epimerase
MKTLVTGSNGFIAGYLVAELLEHGHEVVGIDNFSKYGRVAKSYDSHPRYRLVEGDVKDTALLGNLIGDCDHFVVCAAMIGGISYFHKYAYDLIAENERITASSFDAAIQAFKGKKKLRKVTLLSSSMVYESATKFPTPEGAQLSSPPPLSTYGFQKLATEFFARGAHEQYGLPYTIVRPFNCVGIGEGRALGDHEVFSGNVKLAMSHVVPDLVQKVLKGQDPLHILGDGKQVRHYTYGGDLARGIRVCIEHPGALNEDFNISTARSTTVLELAELIWRKVHGPSKPFRHVSDDPFEYDVQRRVPDVSKAKRVLGYEATTPLETILDEVIPWVRDQVKAGRI